MPRLPFSFTARPNSDIVDDDGVGHAIAEVGDERRDASREVVEPVRELPLRGALVDVRVPAAEFGERDFEADVSL